MKIEKVIFLFLVPLMGSAFAMEKTAKDLNLARNEAEFANIAKLKQLKTREAYIPSGFLDRSPLTQVLMDGNKLSLNALIRIRSLGITGLNQFLVEAIKPLISAQFLIDRGGDAIGEFTVSDAFYAFRESLQIQERFNEILQKLKTMDPALYEIAKKAPDIAAIIAKKLRARIFSIISSKTYSSEEQRALLKFYLDNLLLSGPTDYEKKVDVDRVGDAQGNNPLHWALGQRNVPLAEWIMKNYKGIHGLADLPNKQGQTPLEIGYGLYGDAGDWEDLIQKLVKDKILEQLEVDNAKRAWQTVRRETQQAFEAGMGEVAEKHAAGMAEAAEEKIKKEQEQKKS